MTITKEQLLAGCSTVIKDVVYERTAYYVQAFLNHVKDLELEITVKLPDQTVGDNPPITYNRVFIKAYHPHTKDDFRLVECFCYALDTKTPAAKYFRTLECDGVLFVTNPDMQISLIKQDEPLSFNFNNVYTDNTEVIYKQLNTVIKATDSTILGSLVMQAMTVKFENVIGSIKLADTVPISAHKLLHVKKDSVLFIKYPEDNTYFNTYLAFCKVIQDDKKELFNVCEKLHLALNIILSTCLSD